MNLSCDISTYITCNITCHVTLKNCLNIDYWYGLATLAEKCDVALLQSELDDVERCDWLIDD